VGCDCIDKTTGQPCTGGVVATCSSCKKQVCENHATRTAQGAAFCPICALASGLACCREKVGFLTVKDCKAKAVAVCTGCSCPLCEEHSVATAKGVLCSECAKTQGVSATESKGGYDRHRYAGYYHGGYSPYYWGSDRGYSRRHHNSWHSRHYNEQDAAIFDEHKDSTGAEGFDGDFESS